MPTITNCLPLKKVDSQIKKQMRINYSKKRSLYYKQAMKNELLKDVRFTCIKEVIQAMASAVDFYNNERPHMSINMKTPAMAALCEGEIKKHWFSHREKAIRERAALEIPKNSLPLSVVHGSLSGLRPPVNP